MILAWQTAIAFFEVGAEIAGGIETRHPRNLLDSIFSATKKFGSTGKAYLANELAGCLARDGLELAVEVAAVDTHFTAQCLNVEARLVNVLFHACLHTTH